MSVSSILAFVLAGVAVKKSRAPTDVGDKTHPRFVAGYDAGLNDGKLEAEARIGELERDYDALRRENAAQARALSEPPRRFGQHPLQQHELALQQSQAAQAQLAQYQNYQQNQGLGQAMGLLGAQNLIDTELWCNCVPARHDMFLRNK
jgi:hypothetical protein